MSDYVDSMDISAFGHDDDGYYLSIQGALKILTGVGERSNMPPLRIHSPQ